MITGIAHTAYTVSNMRETLRFYCDKLGLSHAFSIPDQEGKPWIEYIRVAPGQFIEFFYPREGQPPTNASGTHLCLEVDDIHETVCMLQDRDITLWAKPEKGKDHNWQCWISDPDGNPIELMQMDPGSPQARA